MPRETLISHTPILICEQSVKWVPIQRHIVHEEPVLWYAFLGDEVTREEKESAENRADEGVPRYEIRRHRT